MIDRSVNEVIDIGEFDADEWNDYAIKQGWSDGMPLMVPTENKVNAFVDTCRGDNEPFLPMSPRRVIPTLKSIASNSVMAGCKPEHFPIIISAVRALLNPDYNLHGTLATTHPCAPGLILNGPVRERLEINCGSNCFGQGHRANAVVGRAIQLTLHNIGGAKPGIMDRATQGSPAKYSFCFGENQEESPWTPYHVRRGFEESDSVVTVLPCEPPHNINDHASTSGKGILKTIAGTISQTGANVIYGTAPYAVVLGPEHAQTIHRDGYSVGDIQQVLYENSAVDVDRVSEENRINYDQDREQMPQNGKYYLTPSPQDIQVLVAGGPGKHSAYIPTFGFTEACSVRIRDSDATN